MSILFHCHKLGVITFYGIYFGQQKEAESAQLAEDLGVAQARESQTETQNRADMRKVQRELESVQHKHRHEVWM